MSRQKPQGRKFFFTHRTFKGPLSRMWPRMIHHVPRRFEHFIAKIAGEFFHTSSYMNSPIVRLHTGVEHKHLSTLWKTAFNGGTRWCQMCHIFMSGHRIPPRKRFGTKVTFVFAILVNILFMGFHGVGRFVKFLAYVTFRKGQSFRVYGIHVTF